MSSILRVWFLFAFVLAIKTSEQTPQPPTPNPSASNVTGFTPDKIKPDRWGWSANWLITCSVILLSNELRLNYYGRELTECVLNCQRENLVKQREPQGYREVTHTCRILKMAWNRIQTVLQVVIATKCYTLSPGIFLWRKQTPHRFCIFLTISNFSCLAPLSLPSLISLFLSSRSMLSANSSLSAVQKWLCLADSTDKRLNACCPQKTRRGGGEGGEKIWGSQTEANGETEKEWDELLLLRYFSKNLKSICSFLFFSFSLFMFKWATVRSLTCQKGEELHKKLHFFPPQSEILILHQRRIVKSFAFTSNVDDRGGAGSARENEGGLGSSCTS